MDCLKKIEALEPKLRSSSMGQQGVFNELKQLDQNVAIQWLERHIASPVSGDWGNCLYWLHANWATLEAWLRMDKVHCIAAMDAIRRHADAESANEDAPLLPSGASPENIAAAMAAVLHDFNTPRMREIAAVVLRTWPVAKKKTSGVELPSEFLAAAQILLGNDLKFIQRWKQSLPRTVPANDPESIWDALLNFSDSKYAVVIADWRAEVSDVAERLSALPIVAGQSIEWSRLQSHGGTIETLIDELDREVIPLGFAAGSIDNGTDGYVLILLRASSIAPFESAVSLFLKRPFYIVRS